MSSESNSEMMSRNLTRVNWFGDRESVAKQVAGSRGKDGATAFENLRADLACADIKLSRLAGLPKIRSTIAQRMIVPVIIEVLASL